MWVRIYIGYTCKLISMSTNAFFFWWCQPHKSHRNAQTHAHTIHSINMKLLFTANLQQIFSMNNILFIAWCLRKHREKVCSLFCMLCMSFNVCMCVLSVCHQFVTTHTHTYTFSKEKKINKFKQMHWRKHFWF